MRVAIIIPARHASSRYPGKPLALLRGATGEAKTLLARVIDAARRAMGPAPDGMQADMELFVATDDHRIAEEAARAECPVIMTSAACRNGTERVAEAVANADIRADVIINLQGDAPLTPPDFIRALVRHMAARPDAGMATPVLRCDRETLANLLADRRAGRVGATTVVADRRGRALYFSKEVIPFTDGRVSGDGPVPVFHHVGLYAYRPAALAAYVALEPGPLEALEGLEQLRFLENGHPVDVVEVTAPGAAFWELNNPSDIPLVEEGLRRAGIA